MSKMPAEQIIKEVEAAIENLEASKRTLFSAGTILEKVDEKFTQLNRFVFERRQIDEKITILRDFISNVRSIEAKANAE